MTVRFFNQERNSVSTDHAIAPINAVELYHIGGLDMKKIKICDHCDAKFKNRRNLRDHLRVFHKINLMSLVDLMMRRGKGGKPPAEGKPHRRIRMMMNAAQIKKSGGVVNMWQRRRANALKDYGPVHHPKVAHIRRLLKNQRKKRMAA
jgi:hypothetical protein